ncbi:MAG: recombinase family protein [Butyribacter sp.]|nr:recombinase family protein [bacterium]MDY3853912.1 recombinase family protein [Butyribacter sp.]
MKEDKKVIAIYTRKSKYTTKGLSIQNQINTCQQYIADHFSEELCEVKVYSDEGISGKDFERPKMQELLSDIEKGDILALVCYRLDRVSRSVRDFSSLIEYLEKHGIEFVSVSESFDTRTPMGRAMILICSVFAQLERETIAERITDNLYSLAKMGRWLGGQTPLGFYSERVEEIDELGQKRSRVRLEPDTEGQELVKLIYSKYLEIGSLTKLETYLMNAGFRTKNGKYYGRYVLKQMLTNPVYCVADEKVFDYMQKHGYGIYAERELFNGEHGLIAYNKNNGREKVQRINPVEEWIVAVGEHQGIIPSVVWCEVQDKVLDNSKLSFHQPKKSTAILAGMVKCACCGATMRPRTSRIAKDGTLRYSYCCETKEKSRGNLCQMPNVLGPQLDNLVTEEIVQLKDKVIKDYDFLEDTVDKLEKSVCQKSTSLIVSKQMEANERQIQKLLDSLGRSSNEATTNAILRRMDEINEEQEELNKRLKEESSENVANIRIKPGELLAESMLHLDKEHFQELPAQKRHRIMQQVIKEVVWDGEVAEIHLKAEDYPEIQSA